MIFLSVERLTYNFIKFLKRFSIKSSMTSMNFFEKFFVNHFNRIRNPKVILSLINEGNLKISGSTLEIGAGLGYISWKIFEKYHPDHVVITDFDSSQVQKGQDEALKKFGTMPLQIEYRREDVLQLSLNDSSFDFVIGSLCFHHVEGNHRRTFIKTPKAFQEIDRILKPKGTFIYWDILDKKKVDNYFNGLGYHTILSKKRKGIYQKP